MKLKPQPVDDGFKCNDLDDCPFHIKYNLLDGGIMVGRISSWGAFGQLGNDIYLSKEQVGDLIPILQHYVDTGLLKADGVEVEKPSLGVP